MKKKQLILSPKGLLTIFLCFNALYLFPQGITVKGTITDRNNETLIGVTVKIQESDIGTVSDFSGVYVLNNVVPDANLIVSYIGMETQVIPVNGRSLIDIVMDEDVTLLEEVVIVGFGTQQKETVTGAISAVESDKLLQSPVANVSNALAGRVSGLITIQDSGLPGSDQSTLRVRGVGTFTGNSSPLIMIDGIESQNYNNIDPNEIETISILKDASATAVYGVRGANGVLLITTKRGNTGKPKVSFSAQVASSNIASEREYLNSAEWAKGFVEGEQYDSYITGAYNPSYSSEDIQHYIDQDDPVFYPDINWAKLMLKSSSEQSQYNLNINGGTDRVRYFVSGGYFHQGGLFNEKLYDRGFDNSVAYNRYNFRSNFDFNISKQLTAIVNLSAQIDQRKGFQDNDWGYILNKIFIAPPNYSPGVYDGKIVNLPDMQGSNLFNPLTQYFGTPWRRKDDNYLNGTIRFDYLLDFILNGLSVHGTISYQNRNTATSRIEKTLVEYLAFRTDDGRVEFGPMTNDEPMSYSEATGYNRKEDFEFGFDYKNSIGEHFFTGLLLYNQSKEFPGPSLSIPRGYQGLVGRATYDYKKRYLAEINFGYNGTENFAVGKRFGFFPAYSLGWVMSEESFFKNQWIDFFKLRGSYGEVGNDRIGGLRFMYNPSSFTYGGLANYWFGVPGDVYNNYQGSSEGVIGNPELRWERAKKLNIGFDATLFRNFKVSADYFQEKRDDILANPRTVPVIVGIDFPAFNFGKMSNRGFDGEISYNGKYKELTYWSKFVFSIADNKIEYMDEPDLPYPYMQRTGKRYQQTFGLLEEGFYNTWDEVIDAYRPASQYSSNRIQPGDFKYKDINGDGVIDSNDHIPIGYSLFPGRSYGLSFGGSIKGFDISVLFTAASDVTKSASHLMKRGWDNGPTSTQKHVYERAWTQEKYLAGIFTDFPRVSSSNQSNHNYVSNTMWNENSNYVRLKTTEIGYNFSQTSLKKIGINTIRIYLNGNNLFTWANLFPGEDPEVPTYPDSNNEPYPIIRTINTGINIKF